jgi:hypothetical protein
MESGKLHDWLQIIGLAAVVGSLIFVGLQLKQADSIAYAEQAEGASIRGIELRAFVANHAETWQKACLGSELTAAEKIIAGNIYRTFFQVNFNAWVAKDETGVGGRNNTQYTDMFAANLYRYPGFRSMAESFSEWSELGVRWEESGGERYISAITERLAELRQLEPEPNADVMWCGTM